jgi:hypothetical protein
MRCHELISRPAPLKAEPGKNLLTSLHRRRRPGAGSGRSAAVGGTRDEHASRSMKEPGPCYARNNSRTTAERREAARAGWRVGIFRGAHAWREMAAADEEVVAYNVPSLASRIRNKRAAACDQTLTSG